MCIIAFKPEGIKISEDRLKKMWDSNSDGAGMMYADRGKLRIVKGLMTFDNFLETYKKIGDHRKMVLHFRIKTHGAVIPSLTHPFWVHHGKVAMVHNGVIPSKQRTCPTESDTSIYAKELGHRYDNVMEALTAPSEYESIVKEIGYSKLVFMDRNGDHFFVNEKMGVWDEGCWFSNYGFQGWSYSWSSSKWNYSSEYEDYHYASKATKTEEPTTLWQEVGPSEFDDLPVNRLVGTSDDEEWETLLRQFEEKYGKE
jgi:predicted glutamine amidotransferase